MDGTRFDDFARSIADCPSRRRILKALAGGAAGGLVALVGGAAGAAPRCKRVDQACQTSADCCPGNLGNGNVYCASTPKKGRTCQPCPVGTVACDGGCIDVRSDANNCGTCGTICGGGTSCANGVCACPSGQTRCAGQCVNTASDNANCGACGTACFGGTSCANGVCQCPADQFLCADNACHVCCPGLTSCGGVCVDTETNEANCGTCGNACATDHECVAGECKCTEASCPEASGCFCSSNEFNPCVALAPTLCDVPCDSPADCGAEDEWVCITDRRCENPNLAVCARIIACPAL